MIAAIYARKSTLPPLFIALMLCTAPAWGQEQKPTPGEIRILVIDPQGTFTAFGAPHKLQVFPTDVLASRFKEFAEQMGRVFRGVQTVGDYSLDTIELHLDVTTEGTIVVVTTTVGAGLKVIYKRNQPAGMGPTR